MRVLPIAWHGVRRQTALAESLAEPLAKWRADWCAVPVECAITVADAGSADDHDTWLEADRDGTKLLVAGRVSHIRRMAQAFAGVGDAEQDDVALDIGRAALEALAVAIGGDGASAQWMSLVHASSTSARNGVARLVLKVGPSEFALFLGEALCARLVPRTRKAVAVSGAAGMVLDQIVPVRASIDLGTLSLADLAQLSPGDVVKTDARLDSLVQLDAGGSPLAVVATLAQQDNRRSLQIRRRTNTKEART